MNNNDLDSDDDGDEFKFKRRRYWNDGTVNKSGPISEPGAPVIPPPYKCSLCGRKLIARKVKSGSNIGRWFINCPNAKSSNGMNDPCNRMSFRWLR